MKNLNTHIKNYLSSEMEQACYKAAKRDTSLQSWSKLDNEIWKKMSQIIYVNTWMVIEWSNYEKCTN